MLVVSFCLNTLQYRYIDICQHFICTSTISHLLALFEFYLTFTLIGLCAFRAVLFWTSPDIGTALHGFYQQTVFPLRQWQVYWLNNAWLKQGIYCLWRFPLSFFFGKPYFYYISSITIKSQAHLKNLNGSIIFKRR